MNKMKDKQQLMMIIIKQRMIMMIIMNKQMIKTVEANGNWWQQRAAQRGNHSRGTKTTDNRKLLAKKQC